MVTARTACDREPLAGAPWPPLLQPDISPTTQAGSTGPGPSSTIAASNTSINDCVCAKDPSSYRVCWCCCAEEVRKLALYGRVREQLFLTPQDMRSMYKAFVSVPASCKIGSY